MKKLYLLWLLPFSLQFLHAQNYILQGVTGVTGPTGTTGSNIYQDGGGLIGIGTATPGASLDLQCANLDYPILNLSYTYGGLLPSNGPDFIFASNTLLPGEFVTDPGTTTNFDVNRLGQVGIGAANIIGEYPVPLDLFINTHGWPASTTSPNGIIFATDDNGAPLAAIENIGTSTNSSGALFANGNSNLFVPALYIGDYGGNLSIPALVATGNGAVMMGTLEPTAQVDINNNMYADGSYTPLENLFHVGDESIGKDYFTVANNSTAEVGIGVQPTGYSTLAIKGDGDGTGLDIFETDATDWNAQLRFFGTADGSPYLRHLITDDAATTGNLVIFPRFDLYPSATGTVEIVGNELVDVNLSVGGNESVAGTVRIGTEQSGSSLPNAQYTNYQLSVYGQIVAEEVVVQTSNWSDTVFSDKYRIKSLDEVEKFITKNHHLPDVPSEKEVMQNGVSLGEMNKVLLQKVEELTLYTIQLQKEVTDLKQKIK